MKSTNNKGKVTAKPEPQDESLLPMERDAVIQQSALQVLQKLSEEETDDQMSLLSRHATRLTNVAHSFIEDREKKYLKDEMDQLTANPSDFSIDAVIRLSAEARETIKLAMQLKESKVKNFTELTKAFKA